MATVTPNSLLTLHYRLAAPEGRAWVDTFGQRPATLTLGAHQLAPALEARLIGLAEGAQARFELPAGEAFGERDPQRVQRVPMSLLKEHVAGDVHIAVGDTVQFAGVTSSSGASAGAVVTAIDGDTVELDFNHPLAGQAVVFDVHVVGIL